MRMTPPGESPRADDLDLVTMARHALNYLRGNPDPHRHYECKFSLGQLGIPAHVPLLASNDFGFDPIVPGLRRTVFVAAKSALICRSGSRHPIRMYTAVASALIPSCA